MTTVLNEQNISTVADDIRNTLLRRSIKPNKKHFIDLLSSNNTPASDVTPQDSIYFNIPNYHPSVSADIYVKLVESDVKKRGSPTSSFVIDYNNTIFTAYNVTESNSFSICASLRIPEGGFCVWTEDGIIKSPQYKPQLYVVVHRHGIPTEAFISSIFSINTTYRCTNNNNNNTTTTFITTPTLKKEETVTTKSLPTALNATGFSTLNYHVKHETKVKEEPICSINKVGTVHMHVDGDNKVTDLVVQHLKNSKISWKVTNVLTAVGGPQRDLEQYKPTYAAHTPGTHENEEEFEQYMTIPSEEEDILTPLRTILDIAAPYKGFVIEVEQIIGKIDRVGAAKWMNRAEAQIIESASVGYKRSLTHAYEIHFVIDVPNQGTLLPPIELPILMNCCTALGMQMGGWFISTKEDKSGLGPRWCYRSNHFDKEIDKEAILKQWTLLHTVIRNTGVLLTDYSLTCTIERVLGVWNTSATCLVQIPQANSALVGGECAKETKDVEELAKWTRDLQDTKELWVLSPHFLPERFPEDIVQVVEQSLRRNVKYHQEGEMCVLANSSTTSQ